MKKFTRNTFVCFIFLSMTLGGYTQETELTNKATNNIDSFNTVLKSGIEYADEDYFDGATSIVIENTSIRIIPPKAFRLDKKQGNLLVQDWTGSNILIQELNTSYSKMVLGITKETFLKQGYTFISSYDVFTKSGNEGKLFILSFKTGEWEYERMVLLSGNNKKTAWISANYPVIMRHLLYEILESSILNIEF